MTRRGVLLAVATAILVIARYGAANSVGAPTRQPAPKQVLPSRREEALAQLFTDIRNDNFGHIFLSDAIWGRKLFEIKQGPAFKQEKEGAELYNSAQLEFYTGLRYAEVAAYALKSPKIKFLEHRVEPGRIVQYYKLTFHSPESSVRKSNSEFLRERIVKMVLEQGGFAQLEPQEDYDVLWEVIPHRIESVQLMGITYRRFVVKVDCIGRGDITGGATLGKAKENLSRSLGDSRTERSALFGGPDEHLELTPGSETPVEVSVKFADGATETVSFKAILPGEGKSVLATPVFKPSSGFELKAQQLRRRPADALVNFVEEPQNQNGTPSN